MLVVHEIVRFGFRFLWHVEGVAVQGIVMEIVGPHGRVEVLEVVVGRAQLDRQRFIKNLQVLVGVRRFGRQVTVFSRFPLWLALF